MGSVVLRYEVRGVVWVEIDGFPVFSTFGVNPAIFSCVSRAGVVVEDIVESERV